MENLNKQRRNILVGTVVVVFALLGFFVYNIDSRQLAVSVYLPEELADENRTLIAAICPTVHYMTEDLKEEGFEVIKASSTPESLSYLENGEVDFAICSRIPAPGEPNFSHEVIGEGYSFFSGEEMLVMEETMGNYTYFTDQFVSKVLSRFPNIPYEKITRVEDVYDYIDSGIIITTVENTDYSVSEVVHIFNEDGERVRFSWAPVLYYRDVSTTK